MGSPKFEYTIFVRSLNSSGIAWNDSTISSSSKSNNPTHLRIGSLDENNWCFFIITFLATVLQLSQRTPFGFARNSPKKNNQANGNYLFNLFKQNHSPFPILFPFFLLLLSYLYNSYDNDAHPPHAFPHPKQNSQFLSVSATLVNSPYPQY